MLDRRQSVRNISEQDARVECDSVAKVPEKFTLTIARSRRSYLARMIWRQANKVGLAFRMMTSDTPVNDLDERLRKSEIKKRQLQRRINELLGQG
jgi:hypothetical protein